MSGLSAQYLFFITMTRSANQTGPLAFDRLKADVRRAVGGVELYRWLHPEPAGDLRDGGTVRCIAPDHTDRDPSMTIHADGGFKCHACGASGGDVFDLYATAHGRRCEGDEFTRILRELADFAGLTSDNYRREDGDTGDVSVATAQRPEPTPQPDTPPTRHATGGPSKIRRRIMGAIWEVVGEMRPTDTARQWLDSRDIAPHVAHGYGCRDWERAMPEIGTRLTWFDDDELREAGMINGDGKTWWPVRAWQNGRHRERGLAVPVWHPDHPEWPMAWRWRTYSDDAFRKVYQQPSPDGWEQPPLGLCERSPRAELMRGARWIGRELDADTARQCVDDTSMRPLGAYPGEYVVVLCEGETDWLSVATAADRLESGPRIVPVGVTSMAAEWHEGWTNYIAGASGYVAMFDGDIYDPECHGRQRADEIYTHLVETHGPDAIDDRFIYRLQPEDNDLNDRLEAGDLDDYLRANITGVQT